MSRSHPDHHFIRIGRGSYLAVEHLIEQGILCQAMPADLSVNSACGPSGASYLLRQGTPVQAQDDLHLLVGPHRLSAQVFALPSPMYRAVVEASPAFRQYRGIDTLALSLNDQALQTDRIRAELERLVSPGPVPDAEPRLIRSSHHFQAEWRSELTVLRRCGREWFAGLIGQLSFTSHKGSPVKLPWGLDLGLTPMSVACAGPGRVKRFEGDAPARLGDLLTPGVLSPDAAGALHVLSYARGRLEGEQVMGFLLHHASAVFAEFLRPRGMDVSFLDAGRKQAVLDHHFSWLSQYCNAAGLPFQRVASGYTSTTCSLHNLSGTRHGRRFHCPACGTIRDADENAAHNVLIRGLRAWNRHGRR